MKLIDRLREEHSRIECVAGSMRAFVEAAGGSAKEAAEYVRFFESFAGAWHHEAEEAVLFPLLTETLLLPAGRGPVAVLLADHRAMGELLAQLGALAAAETFDRPAFRETAIRYTQSLLHHVDAENSVLFPECDHRLRGIAEPATPPLPGGVAAAVEAASGLVARYPPVDDPELARGEGCVACHAYGETCRGLEREWWNEWEWEELSEHVAAS